TIPTHHSFSTIAQAISPFSPVSTTTQFKYPISILSNHCRAIFTLLAGPCRTSEKCENRATNDLRIPAVSDAHLERFLNQLAWRYATQAFDPTHKVSEATFVMLLEAIRLAPSSFGLQPWRIIVVEDEDLRRELRIKAWNQPQITEASHLVVFCGRSV